MAIDISNRLSIPYAKALSSTKSPDVRFWSSIASGQSHLQLAESGLNLYKSPSIEDALLAIVAKSLGETPASLKQASTLCLTPRTLPSQILSLSEERVNRLRSLIAPEPVICPYSLITLHPLKGLETLPRDTDVSSIRDFANRLSLAMSIVNDVEPGLSSEVAYLIDHVVPLKCGGQAIYSGSSSSLPGIAFMSSYIDDHRLIAEMAIHEAMHTKLFLLQRWDSLFENEEDINWRGSKAYSPWRECMRPVQGVLHGAFVFTAISKFWSVLSTTDDDIAARRAATSSSESLLAIDQVVKRSALTDWGTRLTKALQYLNYSLLDNYPKSERMLSWSPERSIKGCSSTVSDNIRNHLERCHKLEGN
jgi:hypothetical protein